MQKMIGNRCNYPIGFLFACLLQISCSDDPVNIAQQNDYPTGKGEILSSTSLEEVASMVAPNYASLEEGADQSILVQRKKISLLSSSGKLCLYQKSVGMIHPQNGFSTILEDGTNNTISGIPGAQGATALGNTLWIINTEKNELQAPTENKIITLSFANLIALTADADSLWVADSETKKIYQVNPVDGNILSEIPLATDTVVDLSYDGTYFWAVDADRKSVYMFDDRGRVIDLIPLNFTPVGIAAEGLHIWISSEDQNLYYFERNLQQKYTLSGKREATIKFYSSGSVNNYIALPWQMNRQKVLAPIKLAPAATITKDNWDQYAAKFPSNASITAQFELYDIRYHVLPENVGTLNDIPIEIQNAYTVDGEFLKITHPLIQQAVTEINAAVAKENRGDSVYWIARQVYEYTIKKVHYQGGSGWTDAPTTLQRGYGSCTPITYVFMSLARACGLPARYSAGTRFRGKDPSTDSEFHRWAEVYLPGYGWTPVDPSGTGKNPSPLTAISFFGHVPNIDMVLTLGGGGSSIFGWNYNATGGRYAEWSKIAVFP